MRVLCHAAHTLSRWGLLVLRQGWSDCYKGHLITLASELAGSRERERERAMAAQCAFDQLLINKVQHLQHLQHSLHLQQLHTGCLGKIVEKTKKKKNKVIFENVALLKYGATRSIDCVINIIRSQCQ